jgi:hypothetical protein
MRSAAAGTSQAYCCVACRLILTGIHRDCSIKYGGAGDAPQDDPAHYAKYAWHDAHNALAERQRPD